MPDSSTESGAMDMESAPLRSAYSKIWYGAITWIAAAILAFYAILTFGFAFIPIIWVGSMEQLILYVVPAIALPIWCIAMYVAIRYGKFRAPTLVWTGIRYGIITFGLAGLLVMAVASGTPGYIRKTEQFQATMRKQADIPAIRAWAAAYEPASDATPTLSGNGVFVYRNELPDCITTLGTGIVQYTTGDKTVHLIFGGGFGHWGLSVGPKGTQPYGGYTLPLEDGAWVWHEIQ